MLKIKDNVDLKILEKFGFKLNDDCYSTNPPMDDKLCVMLNNREFWQTHELDNNDLEIFYDLVKADLVEKGEG